jgi:hypothetical protein
MLLVQDIFKVVSDQQTVNDNFATNSWPLKVCICGSITAMPAV